MFDIRGTTPVIELNELTVDFPGIRAVNGLDLSVREGEVFGLLGPDGAGKTTTIRVLATIIKPTAGSVKLWGEDILRNPGRIRGKIGYMSQRFNLYGDLTVAENLYFFSEIYGINADERKSRMKELLAFARLDRFSERRAEYLSGGMKQKLALACTLIHRPQILFLDEPTTGVDPVSRREFWAILSDLRAKGMTIVVSTPYMDEAERCSTVAFIDGGVLRTMDTPKAIKKTFSGELVELIAKPQKVAKTIVDGLSYIREVELYGERLHLTVDDAELALIKLKDDLGNKVEIVSISIKAPSLESAFIELIKGNALLTKR
jgi:ABC-2 type transport system ATP-binding protein